MLKLRKHIFKADLFTDLSGNQILSKLWPSLCYMLWGSLGCWRSPQNNGTFAPCHMVRPSCCHEATWTCATYIADASLRCSIQVDQAWEGPWDSVCAATTNPASILVPINPPYPIFSLFHPLPALFHPLSQVYLLWEHPSGTAGTCGTALAFLLCTSCFMTSLWQPTAAECAFRLCTF